MAAFDTASTYVDRNTVLSAYRHGAAIVPSDTTDLSKSTRALYVGVTGDVVVDFIGGETNVTLKTMPVGIHPLQVARVRATGTTATNLVALW